MISAALHFQLLLEGLGLARRRRAFHLAWEPHLDRSIEAQQRWIAELAARGYRGDLAILGAGRLIDTDLDSYEKIASKIHLVDGDPLARLSWFGCRSEVPIQGTCANLSSEVDEWRRALRTLPSSWDEALNYIANIGEGESPSLRFCTQLKSKEFILSLNLLSQLPLTWQSSIESRLKMRFGERWVAEHESEWLESYRQGGAKIIRNHLALISRLAEISALVISDQEFAEYHLGSSLNANGHDAPIVWRHTPDGHGSWEERNQGVVSRIEITSALCGLDFSEEVKAHFDGWKIRFLEPWLWHIVPGAGSRPGIVHRVGGAVVTREGIV